MIQWIICGNVKKASTQKSLDRAPEEAFMLEWNCLKLNIWSWLSANQFGRKPKVWLREKNANKKEKKKIKSYLVYPSF